MSRFVEKLRILLELVKFEHSIFALPYAYIGALYGAGIATLVDGGQWPAFFETAVLRVFGVHAASAFEVQATRWVTFVELPWAAEGHSIAAPTWSAMAWITVAMVGARAFAFIVNRAADREIDARNPRTADRAIPAGRIAAGELWLFALFVLAAFLVAVWQLAPITRVLWPLVLGAFVVYPYTKRFTVLCHYWLGLCLGLAPVGAWVAIGGPVGHPAPWVLGAAVALWTAGFDMIYATQDVECDRRDGVHSMPADRGIARALVQTRVVHALTVALLIGGGVLAGAGWPWYAGICVATALLWYENSIISAEDLSRVDAAFFTTNGIIAIVVFGGALLDWIVI